MGPSQYHPTLWSAAMWPALSEVTHHIFDMKFKLDV